MARSHFGTWGPKGILQNASESINLKANSLPVSINILIRALPLQSKCARSFTKMQTVCGPKEHHNVHDGMPGISLGTCCMVHGILRRRSREGWGLKFLCGSHNSGKLSSKFHKNEKQTGYIKHLDIKQGNLNIPGTNNTQLSER